MPKHSIVIVLKKLLNKLFIQRDLNLMAPKKKVTYVLQQLGKNSLALRTTLR